jgi:hypothetical protein
MIETLKQTSGWFQLKHGTVGFSFNETPLKLIRFFPSLAVSLERIEAKNGLGLEYLAYICSTALVPFSPF